MKLLEFSMWIHFNENILNYMSLDNARLKRLQYILFLNNRITQFICHST